MYDIMITHNLYLHHCR